MKIAAWNVNSLKVRLPHLEEWVRLAQPDALALQETKLEDTAFPHAAIEALGYTARAVSGQKTSNGVALLARSPIEDVVAGIPGWDDPQRRAIAGTAGTANDWSVPAGTVVPGAHGGSSGDRRKRRSDTNDPSGRP